METIPKTNCEKIGFFKKTHGVFGDLILEFDPQFERSLERVNRYFVELEGLLVPFFLAEDGFRYKNANSAILTFDDVESENYAKRMVGCPVFLFKSEIIIDPLETNQPEYLHYLLIDENYGEIGIIQQIDDYSGNVVFTVDFNGNEILIPFNEDFLLESDSKRKTVKLKLPEGLIEE